MVSVPMGSGVRIRGGTGNSGSGSNSYDAYYAPRYYGGPGGTVSSVRPRSPTTAAQLAKSSQEQIRLARELLQSNAELIKTVKESQLLAQTQAQVREQAKDQKTGDSSGLVDGKLANEALKTGEDEDEVAYLLSQMKMDAAAQARAFRKRWRDYLAERRQKSKDKANAKKATEITQDSSGSIPPRDRPRIRSRPRATMRSIDANLVDPLSKAGRRVRDSHVWRSHHRRGSSNSQSGIDQDQTKAISDTVLPVMVPDSHSALDPGDLKDTGEHVTKIGKTETKLERPESKPRNNFIQSFVDIFKRKKASVQELVEQKLSALAETDRELPRKPKGSSRKIFRPKTTRDRTRKRRAFWSWRSRAV